MVEVSTRPFFPEEGTVYKVQKPLATTGNSNEWLIYKQGEGGHMFKADRDWRHLMGKKFKIYVVFDEESKPHLADDQEPGW